MHLWCCHVQQGRRLFAMPFLAEANLFAATSLENNARTAKNKCRFGTHDYGFGAVLHLFPFVDFHSSSLI
jgi:hypothetical protein